MKKLLPTLLLIIASMYCINNSHAIQRKLTTNSFAGRDTILPTQTPSPDSVIILTEVDDEEFEVIVENQEPQESTVLEQPTEYLDKKEQKRLEKEEKTKERQQKEKERLEGKKSFEEFMTKWQPFSPSGDNDVDVFCIAASDLVVRYKEFKDSLNFIKIEVFEIPDEGDGITQAVKITDGNGNARTKESIDKKWTQMGIEIGVMAIELPILAVSGANVLTKFIADPAQLLNFAVISQIRRSIQAINMLQIEVRRSVPIIKEQRELFKSSKEN